MADLHDRFEAKHREVLALRMQVEEMRRTLQSKESVLRDAERDSATLFRQLFDRKEQPEKKAPEPASFRRTDWHYDSQGYCDNPGRGY